jgi:glycosyltransferase involved in cell wall biosynthesis
MIKIHGEFHMIVERKYNHMKILWFANTPCGASSRLLGKGYTKGGWLSTLEQFLINAEGIELSVAFYWVKKLEPFKERGITYYPVLPSRGGSKFARILARHTDRNDEPTELKRLMEVVKTVQPDLIHIHGTEENYGLIQKTVDVPVVVSLQGVLSAISQKYFSGIPKSVLSKGESFKDKLLGSTISYQHRNIARNAIRERRIMAMTKNIIGRTIWDQQVSRLLAPDSVYHEVQELMRPHFFKAHWKKLAYGQTYRIVSTLGPGVYKGLEVVIQAAQLLSEHTDLTFEWHIAGLDEQSDLVQTTHRWLKIGIKDIPIVYRGSLDQETLTHLLVSSDVYCQTSHIENSPNSLCEAMLIGLPCVASAVGGTSSLLQNAKEGLLVQDGDQFALAGAIKALYSDIKLAVTYGTAARNRALKRHKPEDVLQTVLDLYHSLA